jgi:hypothetical protein
MHRKSGTPVVVDFQVYAVTCITIKDLPGNDVICKVIVTVFVLLHINALYTTERFTFIFKLVLPATGGNAYAVVVQLDRLTYRMT